MYYDELLNLPKLNGVTIIDDKTLEEYGVVPISQEEIEELILEATGSILE